VGGSEYAYSSAYVLPRASEVMFRGTGQTSETCRRSDRSLLMVLANTSSLRALWKGSSIIMPKQ
jgi:hypothetical protein